jgi:molybdopterin molybdotransferase
MTGFQGRQYRFTSPAEAVEDLRGCLSPVESESCSLDEARGRVLAADVRTDRPSPAFDYSSMDGFAVRTRDVTPPSRARTLAIRGEVRIGEEPPALPPECVIRIVTGGAIPERADAVVRYEEVEEREGRIEIRAGAAIKPGDNIRRRGENAAEGEIILPRGTVLTPAAVGALAAVGVTRPEVYRRLAVAVITTGDELVPPDQMPTPWQIRNSNGPAVRAILGSLGWIGHVSASHACDEPAAISTAVREAISSADVVFLSGGVSMGHRDAVRATLEDAGFDALFHGLPQRPGKPMLAAIPRPTTASRARLAFGLPGNPISSMVTCLRLAVPAMSRLAGVAAWSDAPRARVRNPDERTLDLWWHRLIRLADDGGVELIDARGSGDIIAGARSDGFIEIPPGAGGEGPWPLYLWPRL